MQQPVLMVNAHARRYVADFVEQFSPQTGVRPIAFEELQAVFRDYYDGGEEARVPLWSLYEGLLAFLLAVRCRPAPCCVARVSGSGTLVVWWAQKCLCRGSLVHVVRGVMTGCSL